MTQRPDTSQLSRYQYDPRSRRYRNRATGQYLSAATVRSAIDTIIDAETRKMRGLAEQLVAGEIGLSEWQSSSAALLKALHVAMGLAANGGLANTSSASLGYIASLIKKQYQYLNKMALQIRNGEQALDGTLVARAALYTQAARGVFEDVARRSAMSGGAQFERRNLGPADHCIGCLSQSAKGWQPIGTLLPIGATECRGNCRCSFDFKSG